VNRDPGRGNQITRPSYCKISSGAPINTIPTGRLYRRLVASHAYPALSSLPAALQSHKRRRHSNNNVTAACKHGFLKRLHPRRYVPISIPEEKKREVLIDFCTWTISRTGGSGSGRNATCCSGASQPTVVDRLLAGRAHSQVTCISCMHKGRQTIMTDSLPTERAWPSKTTSQQEKKIAAGLRKRFFTCAGCFPDRQLVKISAPSKFSTIFVRQTIQTPYLLN
jgi:hypothetical protein